MTSRGRRPRPTSAPLHPHLFSHPPMRATPPVHTYAPPPLAPGLPTFSGPGGRRPAVCSVWRRPQRGAAVVDTRRVGGGGGS
eukprot:354073-Chlamydomonas_euryale.AAC.1